MSGTVAESNAGTVAENARENHDFFVCLNKFGYSKKLVGILKTISRKDANNAKIKTT